MGQCRSFDRPNARQILLTIDLTTDVCEEAISRPVSAIVAYHPPLFKPLSSLRLDNPLQTSLLRCAASGISIFSPHTSVDAMKGGVNDWLVQAFQNVESITPIEPKIQEEEGTGIGRLVSLKQPSLLEDLFPLIKRHLGLQHSGHSNTERGYLAELKVILEDELKKDGGEELEVHQSTRDRDPLDVV
ncbi:hypothetical protein FRC19_001412 [Serendipita sp. 401]|nr:hypothetical protein FRC19_001412 [Serendipita sp. 401]